MKISDLKTIYTESKIQLDKDNKIKAEEAVQKVLQQKLKAAEKANKFKADVHEKALEAAKKAKTKAYIMKIEDYDFQRKLNDSSSEWYYISIAKDSLAFEGIEIDWEYDHDGVGIRSWYNIIAKGWAE